MSEANQAQVTAWDAGGGGGGGGAPGWFATAYSEAKSVLGRTDDQLSVGWDEFETLTKLGWATTPGAVTDQPGGMVTPVGSSNFCRTPNSLCNSSTLAWFCKWRAGHFAAVPGAGTYFLLGMEDGAGNNQAMVGFKINTDATHYYCELYDGGTQNIISQVLIDNLPHDFVLAWDLDNSKVVFYVDSETPILTTPTNLPSNVWLRGSFIGGPTIFSNCRVDKFFWACEIP